MSWDTSTGVSVDLYVRPSRLADAVDDVLVELHRLEADDLVDGVSVHSWPGRVPVRSEAGDAVDRFQEFRTWADERDVSIQPPFSVRTVDSEFTGEHRTYLSTPVVCLAARVGDSLAGVYPHSDGDEHYSVTDGIEALADGAFALDDGAPAGESTSNGADVCSACGGEVINVQGIRTCHDCRGVDRAPNPTRRAIASR